MELTLEMISYFLRSYNPAIVRQKGGTTESADRQLFTFESADRQTFTGAMYFIPGEQKILSHMLYVTTDRVWEQALTEGEISEWKTDIAFVIIPDRENSSSKEKTYPFTALLIDRPVHPAVIINSLTALFNRISGWDKEMHIGALEGKTPQELLDISEDILRRPVLLFDSAFQLLGHSEKYSTENSAYNQTIRIGYTDPETMKRTRDFHILSRLEPNQALVAPALEDDDACNVYYAFQFKGRLLGYACVFCDKKVPDGYVDLLQIFFNNMNYCLQTHYGDNHFGQMMYETILLNLLHREPVSEEWLSDRLGNTSFLKKQGNYILEVLQFDDAQDVSLDFLMRFLIVQFPENMPIIYEEKICLLYAFPELPIPTKSGIEKHTSHLREALRNYRYIAGYSLEFHDIRDISYAYQQAAAAVEFGKSENTDTSMQAETDNSMQPESRSFFFCDYIYPYLLSQTEKEMPVQLLQGELYRQLKKRDANEKTSYLKTLLTYLLCDCNATKAAEMLYVHRNTVRNVIRQIEECYQVSIADIDLKKQIVLSDEIEHYLAKR